MASRQLSRKASVLLQLAKLERFQARSLLVKSPKFNIGSKSTNSSKTGYENTKNSTQKTFPGENYWNSHNFSQGSNNKYGFSYGASKFGNDDNF